MIELDIKATNKEIFTYLKDVKSHLSGIKEGFDNVEEAGRKSFGLAGKSSRVYNEEIKRTNGLIEDVEDAIKGWEEKARRATNIEDIQKYNRKIAEAKQNLNEYKKAGVDSIRAVNKETNTGADLFSKLSKRIVTAYAAKKLYDFISASAQVAAQAEGIIKAFDKLDRPGLLTNLRKATRGTLDDVTLMQAAVNANNLKVPLDQLALYFEFATNRAIQTGESVEHLVDSIVTGIGRKSIKIIDNLGISAAELQKEIKKTGDFATATGVIIQRELLMAGKVADSSVVSYERLVVIWKNMRRWAGDLVNSVFAPAANSIAALAESVKSANDKYEIQSQKVQNLKNNILPLIKTHDDLKAKSILTKDEQVELNKIINIIGSNIPTAITKFDEYGNILEINTEKAKDFITAQKAMFKVLNEGAIKENQSELEKVTKRYDELVNMVKSAKQTVTTTNSLLGTSSTYSVDLDPETIANYTAEIANLGEKKLGLKTVISNLKGELLDFGATTKDTTKIIDDSEGPYEKLKAVVSDLYKQLLNKIADNDPNAEDIRKWYEQKKKQLDEIEKKAKGPIGVYENLTLEIAKFEKQMLLEIATTGKYNEATQSKLFLLRQEKKIYDELYNAANRRNDQTKIETRKMDFHDTDKGNAFFDTDYEYAVNIDEGKLKDELYKGMMKVLAARRVAANNAAKNFESEQDDGDFSFWKLVGLNPNNPDDQKMIAAAQDYVNQMIGIISQMVDAERQAADERVALKNTLIAEKQREIEAEIELNKQGYASNIQLKQQEQEALKKERQKALEDQEKAKKKQIVIDSLMQLSSLITSSANIFKVFSAIPYIGVPLAIAMIGTMIGAFIASKAKAAKLTKLGHGRTGLIRGRSHAEGGEQFEVEGGEYHSITPKSKAKKHLPLLESIRKDDKLGMAKALYNLLDGYEISRDLPRQLQEKQEKLRLSQTIRVENSGISETNRLLGAMLGKSGTPAIDTSDPNYIKYIFNEHYEKWVRR